MNTHLLIYFLLFLVSCKYTNPQNKIFLKSTNNQIIGGTEVSSSDPMSRFVVGLYDQKSQFICTGSLIQNNLILTAAHCVEDKGQHLIIIFDLNFKNFDSNDLNKIRKAESVIVHPNYKKEYATDIDWDDIALIKFSGSLPDGYQPIEILSNSSSYLKRGTAVQMAGFGANAVDIEDVEVKNNKKFKQDLASGNIVCYNNNSSTCYRINFLGTDQLRFTSSQIEGFTNKEIRLNEVGGHGTCVGDSGGPLIYNDQDTLKLIGVTSRGSQFCDGPAIYTNATEYVNWIYQNLN